MTRRRHPYVRIGLTVIAAVLVFVALVLPDHSGKIKPGELTAGAFLRIPIEGIVGAAVLLVLPARARRVAAALLGLGLGVLTLLKVINLGFRYVLARRFNPVLDWPLLGDGYNYLVETGGKGYATGVVVAAIAGTLAVVAVLVLAVVRLGDLAGRHHRAATRAVPAVIAAWVAVALAGVHLAPYAPVAADSTLRLAKTTVLSVPASVAAQKAFAATAARDPWRDVPAGRLLTGLRGKDVVFGVVESYGRSALDNPKMARTVVPALAAGAANLARAGFHARSAYLTSSTFGGGSWLAHATFQSGLWIDDQGKYRTVTAGNRMTLTRAFHKAGWHTVAMEPGNTHAWPEAAFYGYDTVHDARNLGYRGPAFGWSRIPDQYVLAQFQQRAYARPDRGPLMAEVSLTSSHTPFAPIPAMVDWAAVGDGTVYEPIKAAGRTRDEVWTSTGKVRTEYAKAVAYSVTALTSWAATYADDDLVLVIFGDHQAAPTVSGQDASHDVPVSIVAKDPAVLDRIAGWGWQDGLHPDDDAPVWRMDGFRDRFLTTFGPGAITTP
ncbi:MAG TPA: sulfatase [Actinoplanes sp.]|nr:sulfatase [Actinoplanes sp.]